MYLPTASHTCKTNTYYTFFFKVPHVPSKVILITTPQRIDIPPRAIYIYINVIENISDVDTYVMTATECNASKENNIEKDVRIYVDTCKEKAIRGAFSWCKVFFFFLIRHQHNIFIHVYFWQKNVLQSVIRTYNTSNHQNKHLKKHNYKHSNEIKS